MKNLLFFLLAFFLFLYGCSPENDGIRIRIKNASTFNYENVYVNTSGGEYDYGNLQAGETSVYREFELAYQYAYIRLEVNGDTVAIQPIDYVGETPLKNGKYTYEVTTDGTRQNLGLVFKVD